MNPWLNIPLDDYEGHMSAVGQSEALRKLFREIYLHSKPQRLAVLGCTAGSDFDGIDPQVTTVAVGVDVNPAYIQVGQQRAEGLGQTVQWVCGDVLAVDLPQAPFELIHAALLVEYVDPERFFRRARPWLSPHGLLSLVTQQPATSLPAVSSTRFASLQRLAGSMRLRPAEEIASIARAAGYMNVASSHVELPNGKVLAHSVYKLAGAAESGTEK